MLGMVATGITADAPVGTPLVAWLVGLGLVSLLTSLLTLLTLDGARWLDTKVKDLLGLVVLPLRNTLRAPTSRP